MGSGVHAIEALTLPARLGSAGTRWRRLGRWTLTIIVILASLAPLILWRFRLVPRTDLSVYRAAGSAVLHGRTLYGAAFSGGPMPVPLPFTYPPFSAMLFVPLAILPWKVATILWFVASLSCLVFITRRAFAPFLEHTDPWQGLALGVIVALLLWTVPITDTLWFGQINLILMALVFFDFLSIRRTQGVLTGIAAAVKLTPAIFIVYFALTGQRRAATRALATMAACWALAVIVLPKASAQYFFGDLFKVSRPGSPAFFSNQAINGLIARAHGPDWLWIPAGLCLLVVGMRRARRAHAVGNDLAAVTLLGVTSLVVVPISWLATAVWIGPALGVMLGDATRRGRVLATVATFALLVARVPMLADKMVHHHVFPVLAKTLESSYLIVFVAIMCLLSTNNAEDEDTEPVGAHVPPRSGIAVTRGW
ncbi:MAG: glycosyltransferase 87 family protein [Actinomycetota bacterium]